MLPLQEGLVYGPVRSRRLGHSLGVNILPRHTKLCTFNCSYCQYGWTRRPVAAGVPDSEPWPAPASVAKVVGQRLQRLLAQGERVDRITLAGNGEPTLHPDFAGVVAALRAMRDASAPALPIAILSNSSTLEQPAVVEALNSLDERYMKLDAGEAALFRRVNAAQVPLERVLDGLRRLDQVVVQSMFVKDRLGRIDNTTDLAVAQWIAALQGVAPQAVHVYTIDRAPAWPYLQPIPAARLDEIGRRARAAGLVTEVFGAAPAPARQAAAR
jgi:wyosine [tRNA(Phe)-imidazoG37] synthetase (radical SAM superfamily)